MKKSTRNSEIKALEKLRLPELQAKFAEVTGEKSRSPNRTFLIRRIAETLEARDAAPAPATEAALASTAPEAAADASPADAQPEVAPQPEATATPDAVHDEASTEPAAGEPEAKLSKLDVPALQAKYREVVGRDTSSTNRSYLIWKLRQAQKGRIPVGPRAPRREGEAGDFKVLPLRMEAELVAQLDEARGRLGLKSRMELFRRSLHAFLLEAGEVRVAQLFAP